MTENEYDFYENMNMSNGIAASSDIAKILCERISGAVTAFRATTQEDREGTDWWVKLANGKLVSIDVKVRRWDRSTHHEQYDDLALETYSVIDNDIPGWTRDERKKSDYILWYWQDTRRYCLVPFLPLCKAFQARWENWRRIAIKLDRRAIQRTKPIDGRQGWRSECIYVPRLSVWRAIFRECNGLALSVF